MIDTIPNYQNQIYLSECNLTIQEDYRFLNGEYLGHFYYESSKWDVAFSIQTLNGVLCIVSQNEPLLKNQRPIYELTFAGKETSQEIDFSIESLPEYMLRVILKEDGTPLEIRLNGANKKGYVLAHPKDSLI